jgi:hypothetical protein
MRLLTIVYDSGMDERVSAILTELGVTGWTKQFNAHGFGGAGLKLNSPIFPGMVYVLWIVLEEADVERVAGAMREMRVFYRRNPGLTMWTQAVELL